MFNRIKKATKKSLEKEAKAQAQAIEDAKSDAQKAYEKLREDSKDAALAYAKEAQAKLASMGWRWYPIIQHINPNLHHIVGAQMVLTELPWESWEKKSKEAKEGEAGTEAAAPDATQASPEATGEAQETKPSSDTPEAV